MTINSKLKYLPIAALAVAVSVAGCSSSSDDDPVMSMMPEPETPVVEPEAPEDTTEMALTAAEEALEEAMAALEALEADEDATPAQIATAKAVVLTAEEALADAQTAHDEYVATTPEAIAAAAAEAQERAEGLAAAIDGAKAGDDGFATDFVAEITATHDGDAATVKLTAPVKYKKQDMGPAAIDGWDGSRWSLAGTKSTEHVTVYSDIDAPSAKALTQANLMTLLESENDLPTGVTFTEATRKIVFADNTAAAHLGYAVATSLTLAEGGETTHSATSTATGLRFDGTFGGAAGDFSCTGAGDECQVTVDDKGVVQGITGVWTFDADVGAMVLLPDRAYLNLGWWVKAPAKADGEYEFQTFVTANGYDEAMDVTVDMTGTATYKGAAAGLYVLKDVSGGLVTGASNGEFTASATLNADFLDDTRAGVISGSITDFMNGAGDSMDGWSVTLNNAALALTGNLSGFSGTTVGKIGDGSGAGNWDGTFYGTDGAATNARPSDVAGRFDAHLPGAHVAGAYGASR